MTTVIITFNFNVFYHTRRNGVFWEIIRTQMCSGRYIQPPSKLLLEAIKGFKKIYTQGLQKKDVFTCVDTTSPLLLLLNSPGLIWLEFRQGYNSNILLLMLDALLSLSCFFFSVLKTQKEEKSYSVKIWLGGVRTYIVKDDGVYLMRMATLLLNR